MLSYVQLFVTPWTVASQAPVSVGFSRQEYWSGLACPPTGDLPNPGIKPRCPTLQADSLPAEPQGTPKNTGMGSLSLLQWIFLTQESNGDLLHSRRILYQLSYEGSPYSRPTDEKETAVSKHGHITRVSKLQKFSIKPFSFSESFAN